MRSHEHLIVKRDTKSDTPGLLKTEVMETLKHLEIKRSKQVLNVNS